jgi:acyl-CoA synthetase (AMP-forming)/AMP-acid ligase II
VNHSGAAVLVTTEKLLGGIDRRALESPTLITTDGTRSGEAGDVLDYEAVMSRGASAFGAPLVGADDPAYILYTSGTTGRPKGACHTHGSRVAALVNMVANEISADASSGMIHAASLSHGSGSKVLTFLALGARNVIMPRFDPEEFARAIQERGGTHSFMVPTMLQMLIEAGPKVCRAVRGMRQLTFGGAPITNTTFGRALEAFGSNLVQIYGTSEAPHPVTVLRPDDYRDAENPASLAETAGRPGFGMEIAIAGEDGSFVGQGEEGELLVRSNHVMRGYWRDEAATAEVFAPGGWYKTGDVAVIDEVGFVRFKDRKRDLIISGGLNVYPSEVERVIAGHPNVREVAVIGYPDERWGESVMAVVVPNEKASASEQELIGWLEGRIAGYKKPRRVTFMEELPKGSTNKVLKRALREKLWAGHARRIN